MLMAVPQPEPAPAEVSGMSAPLTVPHPLMSVGPADNGYQFAARLEVVDALAGQLPTVQQPSDAQLDSCQAEIAREGESGAAWEAYALTVGLEAARELAAREGLLGSQRSFST